MVPGRLVPAAADLPANPVPELVRVPAEVEGEVLQLRAPEDFVNAQIAAPGYSIKPGSPVMKLSVPNAGLLWPDANKRR